MKVIKTENTSKSMEVFKNGITKVKNSFKNNFKRNMIIFGALVLVCGAVILNIKLLVNAEEENYDPSYYDDGSQGTNAGADDGGSDSYFAMAQLDRAQARDEELEVLYSITASESATEEEKNNAYTSIEKIAKTIEQEANIETLIKSKGFEECVAVIGESGINVIVSCDSLMPSQIAQIQEIVYEQSNILPSNVKIIEK